MRVELWEEKNNMTSCHVTVPFLNSQFLNVPNLCQDGGDRGCPGQGGAAPSGPTVRGKPLQPDGQDLQACAVCFRQCRIFTRMMVKLWDENTNMTICCV